MFPLEVVFTGTSIEPSTQEDLQDITDPSCDVLSHDCTSHDCSNTCAKDCSNEGTSLADSSMIYIHGKVVVYASLSGMVCFNSDGTIEGCNHHFALMLFGYSQKELLKKVHVVMLIMM